MAFLEMQLNANDQKQLPADSFQLLAFHAILHLALVRFHFHLNESGIMGNGLLHIRLTYRYFIPPNLT